MSYWGKLLGGVAGFAVAGPFGAMIGAALGHGADTSGGLDLGSLGGQFGRLGGQFGRLGGQFGRLLNQSPLGPARLAASLGSRDQLFAVTVVVLSAKLAKADGPVNRAEVDAFKTHFRIPPASVRDIGRLFDQARETSEGYQAYATELGRSFAQSKGLLEDVLAALFAIARADKPLTVAEHEMLRDIHHAFGLDNLAWDQARGATAHRSTNAGPVDDAYAVLGATSDASPEMLRAAWLRLMRENHPDSLAAKGVPPEFIARASEKVARINAAWDRIKRERGL